MSVEIQITDESGGCVYMDLPFTDDAADAATELQSALDAAGVLWS